MNLDTTIGQRLLGLSVTDDTTCLCLETDSGDYLVNFGMNTWLHSIKEASFGGVLLGFTLSRSWITRTELETVTTYELQLRTTSGQVVVEVQATAPLFDFRMGQHFKKLEPAEFLLAGLVSFEAGDGL
ncbi:MAG: hypothetical protein EOP04_22655 [Proteobacteria bacterium]|nr:MAG: hypothetical protein EOP04_22655 [Pseudomonadota bacterium]